LPTVISVAGELLLSYIEQTACGYPLQENIRAVMKNIYSRISFKHIAWNFNCYNFL